jgi:multidrug efflux pump subunit AcrA (membrane-fusion protein)
VVDSVAAEEGQTLTASGSALTTSEGALLSISDTESMALSVEIDELDISAVKPGLETDVEIDAIEGETFHGSVTEVSDEADVETGVAKYSAVIKIERSDAMKPGMSATATITKEKREGALAVPLNAVQEFGDRVFVYTGVDDESGSPTGDTEVETGLSDGTHVEIVSGLDEGDRVYYMPPASEDGESQMMFPGMRGGGAIRVDGERPSFQGSGGAPSRSVGGASRSGDAAPGGN